MLPARQRDPPRRRRPPLAARAAALGPGAAAAPPRRRRLRAVVAHRARGPRPRRPLAAPAHRAAPDARPRAAGSLRRRVGSIAAVRRSSPCVVARRGDLRRCGARDPVERGHRGRRARSAATQFNDELRGHRCERVVPVLPAGPGLPRQPGDAPRRSTACPRRRGRPRRPPSGPTRGRPTSRSSGTCAAPRRTRSPRRASRPPGPRSSSPSRPRSTTASEQTGVGRRSASRAPAPRRAATTLASMPTWFQTDQVRPPRPPSSASQRSIPSPLPTVGRAARGVVRRARRRVRDDVRLVHRDGGPRDRRGRRGGDRGGAVLRRGREEVLGGHDVGPQGRRPSAASRRRRRRSRASQHYVGSLATGHVSDVVAIPTGQGTDAYYLFLADEAHAERLRDDPRAPWRRSSESSNTSAAELLGERHPAHAGVTVSPALGTWELTSSSAAPSSRRRPPPPSTRSSTSAANTPAT